MSGNAFCTLRRENNLAEMSAHLRGKFPVFRLRCCKILSLAVTTRTEKRCVKKKTTERDNVQLRENVIKVLPCGGRWAGPLEGNQVKEGFALVAGSPSLAGRECTGRTNGLLRRCSDPGCGAATGETSF